MSHGLQISARLGTTIPFGALLCILVVNIEGRRQLRSVIRRLLYNPRYALKTYSRRAFAYYAGPSAWN